VSENETRLTPLVRVRIYLLLVTSLFVSVQIILSARREDGLEITALIIGTAALGGALGSVLMRRAARRAADRMKELLSQGEECVAIVVYHSGLRGFLNRLDRTLSVGTYPVIVLDSVGVKFLAKTGQGSSVLAWRHIHSVRVTQLSERFFIRKAIELKTVEGSVVLAPYGRPSGVGLRAPSEETFQGILCELNRHVVTNLSL